MLVINISTGGIADHYPSIWKLAQKIAIIHLQILNVCTQHTKEGAGGRGTIWIINSQISCLQSYAIYDNIYIESEIITSVNV